MLRRDRRSGRASEYAITGIAAVAVLVALFLWPRADKTEQLLERLLGTEWYGVYMKGQKIGYMRQELRREGTGTSARWTLDTKMQMTMNVLGTQQQMATSEKRIYGGPSRRLISCESRMTSMLGPMTGVGSVEGDEIVLKTMIAGRETVRRFPVPNETLDGAVAEQLAVMRGELEVGDTFTHEQFEASPMLPGLVTVCATVRAREKRVFFGVETDVIVFDIAMTINKTTIKMTAVADTSGRLLQAAGGPGIALRLESEELAKRIDYSNDILVASLIRVPGFRGDPRTTRVMRARIGPLEDRELLINSNRQSFTPADQADFYVVTVRQESFSESSSPSLPIRDSALAAELAPTERLQSDAPEIAALAREIVGNETNAWRAAKLLNSWVYENIEKKFVPSMPNALDTLRGRRGDCGEHAALFVALCRAAGIPAREATGIVCIDMDGVKAFGFHAWGEVWVGRWIAMDPSWGEEIANAAHVQFARGGIESQIRLISIMGELNIEMMPPPE